MRPLDGITVLDLTRLLPGAAATLLLSNFGAEVIKIEEPGGDYGRRMPPFIEGVGAVFHATNRGKKNLELMENLKRLATDRGVTVAQLALAWVFHQPGVTAAIAGSRSSTHTAENAGAGKVALSEADLDEIESLL